MGRRYIGVEQMDYIESIAVERLKKVIEGEQGGISKSQNWQGGGSFVYCELKNDAQNFAQQLETFASTINSETQVNEKEIAQQLMTLYDELYRSSALKWQVFPQNIAESSAEFSKLSLNDKIRALYDLIDKNQLYVNYSEINDTSFQISDVDKELNSKFYGDNQ
jgi:adenine-specific DNA-methyltransferase